MQNDVIPLFIMFKVCTNDISKFIRDTDTELLPSSFSFRHLSPYSPYFRTSVQSTSYISCPDFINVKDIDSSNKKRKNADIPSKYLLYLPTCYCCYAT